MTFAAVEDEGVEGFLDHLRKELVERTYRPQRTEGGNTEGWRTSSRTFDSDGDFILHFLRSRLRIPSESCMSCVPSLGASVRLFR